MRKTERIYIRVSPEEKKLLKILAERYNLSISGLILRLAYKEYYNIK